MRGGEREEEAGRKKSRKDGGVMVGRVAGGKHLKP